jgi:hypothetical protein
VHVQHVARVAERIAPTVAGEPESLIAAAFLHDVGCSARDRDTRRVVPAPTPGLGQHRRRPALPHHERQPEPPDRAPPVPGPAEQPVRRDRGPGCAPSASGSGFPTPPDRCCARVQTSGSGSCGWRFLGQGARTQTWTGRGRSWSPSRSDHAPVLTRDTGTVLRRCGGCGVSTTSQRRVPARRRGERPATGQRAIPNAAGPGAASAAGSSRRR